MFAIAAPLCCPGYHASITPATFDSHGISTGPAVCSTTIVRGFASATALISAFWSPGSSSDGRSIPSLETSLANTIATRARRAARTAAACSEGSGRAQPTWSAAPPIEEPVAYVMRIGTR